jgi:hypothetical protein
MGLINLLEQETNYFIIEATLNTKSMIKLITTDGRVKGLNVK